MLTPQPLGLGKAHEAQLKQHLGDNPGAVLLTAPFCFLFSLLLLALPAFQVRDSPCISQSLCNFLDERSGPDQCSRIRSVQGTAGLLEHKEHLCQLLSHASFCRLLLKPFAQKSAGTCALRIYTQ